LGISLGNLVDNLWLTNHYLWSNHFVVTTTSRGRNITVP